MQNRTRVTVKIIVMLLISGTICLMNTDSCNQWIRMRMCSPESYYHDVVSRQMRQWTASAEKIYVPLTERLASTGQPRRITCKVEPGNTMKALSGHLGLDSAALISEGERAGEEVMGQITLQINGKDALHANGFLNYSKGYGHVQIPEFSEARLTFFSWLQQEQDAGCQGDKYLFSLLGDAGKYLPQVEDLSVLLARYPYLVLGQEVTVTRSRKQVQAGDLSKQCTQFTASYSGETCYQICQDLLENLEQDSDTLAKEMKKELQDNAPEVTWEVERDMRQKGETKTLLERQLEVVDTGYQAAVDFLQEKQEALADHKEKFRAEQMGAVVKLSVDSVGNIVERSITLHVGEKTISVSQSALRKGFSLGYELQVIANDIMYLNISGNGTIREGKLSGAFDISMDECRNPDADSIQSMNSILQLSIQDLDLQALVQKQEIHGEVEISTEQIPAWKYYRLKVSMDHARDKSNDRIQIMTGNSVFATIDLQLENGDHPDVGERKNYDGEKNSYRLSDLGELANYASEIDLDQVLEKIEKNCGVNFN
ncbi:MAG: hypothetical protein K2J67_02225 [Lachnospiraceae bacterium]|nr:hypothetical protein [Lachnospiraceae bacterium]